MSNTHGKRESLKSSCMIAGLIVLMAVILGIAGFAWFLSMLLGDFDFRREMMCLRPGLIVSDEHLCYGPGIDAAMWSKFTVRAKGIGEVFDTSRVDTSEFTREGFQFKVEWIDDPWWDADLHRLIGGEVKVGEDFMRVGYDDNRDGTLTVYIFWFEV